MTQRLITGGNGTSGQSGSDIKNIINQNFTELYDKSTTLENKQCQIKSQEFIAIAGQTLFTLTNGSYTMGTSSLFVNVEGTPQAFSSFTETSSTSFTLSEAMLGGELVFAYWFAGVGILTTNEVEDASNSSVKNKSFSVLDDRLESIESGESKQFSTTPSTPASGYTKLYPKNDGKFYKKNSSGLEKCIESQAIYFQTIAEMKASTSLVIGEYVVTLGYYVIGDGGGAEYITTAQNSINDDVYVRLDNGLTACLIYTHEINVKILGIRSGSNTYRTNNADKLVYYIRYYPVLFTFLFPCGTYYFSKVSPYYNASGIFVSIKGEQSPLMQVQFQKVIIYTEGDNFIYDENNNTSGFFVKAENIFIQSANQTGRAFGSVSASECAFDFKDVYIEKFDYGFFAPSYSTNARAINTSFSLNHYGIYFSAACHLFYTYMLTLNNNVVGIRSSVGGIGAKMVNTHISVGYYQADKNNYTEWIGIHTKGGLTIDSIYYEDYIGALGQPEKQIIVDYEYYSYGVDPLRILNTPIQKPSGSGGLFLRFYQYSGNGKETDINNAPTRYFTSTLFFDNCTYVRSVLMSQIIELNSSVPQLGVVWDGKDEVNLPAYKLINKPNYKFIKDGLTMSLLLTKPTKTLRYFKWNTTDDISNILVDGTIMANPSNLNIYKDFIHLKFAYRWIINYRISGEGITPGTYNFGYVPEYVSEDPTLIKSFTVPPSGSLDMNDSYIVNTSSINSNTASQVDFSYVRFGFIDDTLPSADYTKLKLEFELIQLGDDRYS